MIYIIGIIATIAAAFTATESLVTPNGVIFANYKRAGEVTTGTVGAQEEIRNAKN